MTDRICDTCQKPVPAGAPGGLCPRCLLSGGLGDGSAPTTTGQPGSTIHPDELPDANLTPELLGRYTTIEGSGQGGMGKVYLVRDAQLGREVALKELLPRGATQTADSVDEEQVALARFTREARVTAQLQHPAITPVYELGRRVDGSYYYTMKHIRGKTLAAAIKDAKTLDERLKLLPNFAALCHAIAFAHSRGVIHRDIKPANVMVGDFGETVVVDWGLAKIKGVVESAVRRAPSEDKAAQALSTSVTDDGLQTMHGTALGTPAYMPPEQAQGLIGSLDQRSDIYSLGAVLYEILAGRRPFAGASGLEVLNEVLSKPPAPLSKVDPNIPLEYVAICERAMSRLPEERPSSASELAEQIQNVRLRGPKSHARKWAERAALALLLLIPLGLMVLNRWTDSDREDALARLSTKGFDLRSGPADYASYGRPSATLPAGARHAAGTLYALTWEFPQLGDSESDLWKRVNALRVRDASFPWPKDSEKHIQTTALASEVVPVLTAVRSIAALPRGGGRAVVKKAMDLGGTPFATEIPNLTALMSGATLLAHSSYLAHINGQTDQALDATGEGLRFASHLEDIPFLIGVLARSSIITTTLRPFENVPLAHASEAALSSLEASLRENSLGPSVSFAVESEIRSAMYAFHLVRTGRSAEVASVMEGTRHNLPPLLWAVYGRGPLRFWGNRDEILFLSFMTDCLEATRRPVHEGLPDLRRIDQEVERTGSWLHPMLGMFPSVKGTVERVASSDSAISRARIRVALERHRLKRGAFPRSLDELVPEWLEAIPLHALTGAPFVYTLTPAGYDLSDPS
jgi:serine/threonine protein kinase